MLRAKSACECHQRLEKQYYIKCVNMFWVLCGSEFLASVNLFFLSHGHHGFTALLEYATEVTTSPKVVHILHVSSQHSLEFQANGTRD